MALITLLVLTGMQYVLLFQRAVARQENQHQEFYQLEHLARQLAVSKTEKSCVLHQDNPNQVWAQLRAKHGCSLAIKDSHYQYLIEDLGVYPCLVVDYKKQKYTTRHLRVSLLVLRDDELASSLLQIRVVKPAGTISCTTIPRQITKGISSWRYVTGMGE